MTKDYAVKVFDVEEKDTAYAMGSGDLAVLATPALVAMLENTAKESILNLLDEDQTTVGIEMQLNHVAATAVGQQVVCKTTLVKQDKSVLFFEFDATVQNQVIAAGTHKRAIVVTEKFLGKLR